MSLLKFFSYWRGSTPEKSHILKREEEHYSHSYKILFNLFLLLRGNLQDYTSEPTKASFKLDMEKSLF